MIHRAAASPLLVSSDANQVWQTFVPEASRADHAADLTWTGENRQTMEGFGGCFNELGWIALQSASEDQRERVLDALFQPDEDGLRFDFCRIPIGATDYSTDWYSCNETDGDFLMAQFTIERDKRHLLPYVKSALRRNPDMALFASPWSPPTWMKYPRVYNYGKLVQDEAHLTAYALYLLKFVLSYEEQGVRLKQIHFQNEPVTHHRFPSCVWTGEEMRDFVRDYIGPLLRQNKPEVELWLGTLNSELYDPYAGVVLADPEARKFLSGVGYQWAGKQSIQRTHIAWPRLRLMQTENECGDGTNSWSYAHYVFGLLWHYLNNGAESYIYWNMVLPEGGECTWGGRQNSLVGIDPDTGIVRWNPEFYLFKHICRFVGKGSVRVELAGSWGGNALAFENPEGRRVIVVNNPYDSPNTLTVTFGETQYRVPMSPNSFHTLVL